MSYKLTSKQSQAITELDTLARSHGLPTYYDFVKAAAVVMVGLRESNKAETTRGKALLSAALEGLRNDSADPRPVTTKRL